MHDLIVPFIFYFFAGLAVFSALMVVTQNNPVRCVLFLVLTFFAAAILWILVAAEFLALILVLVYVGAVMTLFLFVVMMLDIDVESKGYPILRYLPFGFVMIALLMGLLLIAVPDSWYQTSTVSTLVANSHTQISPMTSPALSNTQAIGMALYTDYVYAVELAAVLLLVAIVSAITLAHRGAIGSKRQNVLKQIMTDSRSRVALISMKSEK